MKSGILLLDKPNDLTSFDCIRQLKRTWRRTDLGHGGTLDRFATGLLPILVGEGLKLARFFLESYPQLPTYWKSYAGTIELGTATETGDPEGAVVERRPIESISLEAVTTQMATFVACPYDQMPPKYSAKKIDGSRASDLAREGKEPELKPVRVTIREFRCTGLEGSLIRFEATCSKGAYIRSLAEDLARKLGTVGHTKELRRIAVGTFRVSDSLTLQQVEQRGADAAILEMATAVSFLEPFPALGAEVDLMKRGQVDGILTRLANSGLPPNIYCATMPTGPVALLELTAERRGKFMRALLA